MATVDVVIPVYNEQHSLPRCIATLWDFLSENIADNWTIVIADNGSTDSTLEVCQALALQYPKVRYIHLEQKGRGRALRRAWLETDADIVSYMDVDLSTGLEAFPKLVSAIKEGYTMAIGSRLLPESRTTRSPKREFISRAYNLMIKVMFWPSFSDAQCGFKAMSRKAVRELMPLAKDQAWFLDTELLLLATLKGYRIKEIPVAWVEDPDSRVHIGKTAWEDIKGLLRMRFLPLPAVVPYKD
ncbi:MAG: glycosyltransferase family 2 protein [Chloroflexi bacterium]|nr:glycosyltransferase family 2 protein [Chloroflexota bacterium]